MKTLDMSKEITYENIKKILINMHLFIHSLSKFSHYYFLYSMQKLIPYKVIKTNVIKNLMPIHPAKTFQISKYIN